MNNASKLLAAALLVAVTVLSGCQSGSSSTFAPAQNNTGPRLVEAHFIDIDGNGVDQNDILVLTFERSVFITTAETRSFEFDSGFDTFGTGAKQTQSVSGSSRVEIVLGASPSFVLGSSALNVVPVGTVTVTDSDEVPARPSPVDVAISDFSVVAPTMVSSCYVDADNDGTINVGDVIVCEFDKPVTIPGGETVATNFATPVTGDSFGTGAGLSAVSAESTNRGVIVSLGTAPTLTVSGDFDPAVTAPGSPSGVAVSATPGITDTTAAANVVTASTVLDLDDKVGSRFVRGQAGALFLGNQDASASDVSASGYFGPRGMFHFTGDVMAGATLVTGVDLFFVADNGNNRVLVYDGKPTGNGASANAVLGQVNLTSGDVNGGTTVGGDTLWSPSDVVFDGDSNKLIVSDTRNNRVLIYHGVIDDTGAIALIDGQSADVVIGQASFAANDPNQSAVSPTSRTLFNPRGLSVSGGQLAVADTGNSRVLIWSTIPTANNADATTVLGQASFMDSAPNGGGSVTASVMNCPRDVVIDGTLSVEGSTGAVLVADTGNNRIVIFEDGNPMSGDAADRVIGQPDAMSSAAATSATGLSNPAGVAATATEVYVADRDNHRVMIYSIASLTADGAAGTVMGQGAATSAIENRDGTPSADSFSFPRGVEVSDAATQELFVADRDNHRVLNWTTVPTSDTPADLVQGQDSFLTSDAKGHLANRPSQVFVSADRLFMVDTDNNRVLIYNTVPGSGTATPDVVVGQDNVFDTLANQGGVASLATMSAPEGAATDGTRLVVADTGNNRVLVFSTIPTTDGEAAAVVLGQSTASGTFPNSGGISAATLDSPVGVALDGNRLFVADRDNHRVLIFSDITAVTTGSSADVVVGQMDFTSNFPNHAGDVRPNTLESPQGVAVSGTNLWVADTGNNRVLGYGPVPTVNGVDATIVVGQSTFDTDFAGANKQRLSAPTAIASDGVTMVISDTGSHRVVSFNAMVTDNNPIIDSVLGQPGFTFNQPNRGSAIPSIGSLFNPRGLFVNGLEVWVADQLNSRLVRFR